MRFVVHCNTQHDLGPGGRPYHGVCIRTRAALIDSRFLPTALLPHRLPHRGLGQPRLLRRASTTRSAVSSGHLALRIQVRNAVCSSSPERFTCQMTCYLPRRIVSPFQPFFAIHVRAPLLPRNMLRRPILLAHSGASFSHPPMPQSLHLCTSALLHERPS